MMKNAVFIVCWLFFSVSLNAQMGVPADNSNIDGRGASSKEAIRAVDNPTGTLKLQIPLGAIEARGKIIPIALTYDGSGLQVNTKASWVGHGWDLSIGETMSRKIQGSPDDVNNLDDSWGPVNASGIRGYLARPIESHFYTDEVINSSEFLDIDLLPIRGHYDGQPDIYSFSTLNGDVCSFSIAPINGLAPNRNPHQGIRIVDLTHNFHSVSLKTDNASLISGFISVALDGTKYVFDVPEKIIYSNLAGVSNLEVSKNWLLSSISNFNNDQLFTISYTDEVEIDGYGYYSQLNKSKNQTANGSHTSQDNTTLTKRYITEITTIDGFRVVFNLQGNERTDLPNHKALESIEIFSSEEILLKRINFLTSYFNGQANPVDPDAPDGSRLRLDEIQISDFSDFASSENIAFSYYSNGYLDALPSAGDKNIDLWGFYNYSGSISNNNYTSFHKKLLANPEVRAEQSTPHTINGLRALRQLAGNANRKPSLLSTQMGNLKTIQYESGKRVDYEYELNEYSFVEDIDQPVTGQKTEVRTRYAAEFQEDGSAVFGRVIDIGSVDFPQWSGVKYSKGDGCHDYARLVGYENGETSDQLYISDNSQDYTWVYLMPGIDYQLITDADLNSNNQTEFCPRPPNSMAPFAQLVFKSHDEDVRESFVKKAGGLRVYKVKTSDGNGNSYTELYNYNQYANCLDEEGEWAAAKSSGVIVAEPNTVFQTGQVNENNTYLPILSNSSSKAISGFNQANSVYYTTIEKILMADHTGDPCTQLSSLGQGRVINEYAFYPIREANLTFPFVPSMDGPQNRTNLLSQKYYDNTGEIVSEIYYEYDRFSKGDPLRGWSDYLVQVSENSSQQMVPEYTRTHTFSIRGGVNRLKKITTKDFFDGSPVEISSKYFEYTSNLDSETPYLPLRVYNEYADGSQRGVDNYYTSEIEFACATGMFVDFDQDLKDEQCSIHSTLNSRGVYLPVVQHSWSRESSMSGYLDGEQLTIQTFEQNGDKIEPHKTISRFIPEAQGVAFTEIFTPNENDQYSEITDRNIDGYVSETVNEIGKFSSSIYDQTNRVVAAFSNGQKSTSFYTSFEDWDNDDDLGTVELGGWEIYDQSGLPGAGIPTPFAGDGMFRLGYDGLETGQISHGVNSGMSYILSYWKYTNGLSPTPINVIATDANITYSHGVERNGWTYFEHFIEWSSAFNSGVTLAGTGIVDELTLRESDSNVSVTGYYPDGKIRFQGNEENYSFFEYDSKGRLEWLTDPEGFVLEYHQYFEKDLEDESSFNKHVAYLPKRKGIPTDDVTDSGNSNDVVKTVTYTDGLGRFRQKLTFGVHGGSSTKDKVEIALYDDFGRQPKKYLPYYTNLSGDDSYRPNADTEQLAYYQNLDDPQERTDSPWIETLVESSPLQRVIEQGGIGDELQPEMGHSTTIEYGWNEETDEIYQWQYVENGAAKKAVLVNTELMWPAGTLRKVTTTDPDGKVTKVFKDMRGREVARSVLAHTHFANGKHETGKIGHTGDGSQASLVSYTVRDGLDRPRFEISPFAMEDVLDQLSPGVDFELNSTNRTNLYKNRIVYYDYDDKGRLSYRSVPIDNEVHYVFDVYDRVIMSQDSEQAIDDKWSFIKYDSQGRKVMTGEMESSLDREAHQAAADLVSQPYEMRTSNSGPSGFNYTNDAYPTIEVNEVYSAYFFDNYDFNGQSSHEFVPFGDITTRSEVTRGLATGSRVRVFEGDGTSSQTLLTVLYYDDDAQIIQTHTKNHKGGSDRVDNYFNEYGQIDQSIQHHKYGSTSDTHTFKTRYVYFPESRKVQNTYCQLDDDPEVLISNRWYDEKGQLKDLKYHRKFANYLQRIDYRYNAQGRLTHINNTALIDDGEFNHDDDDIFGQELTYFTPSPEYNDPGSVQYGDPLAEYNFVPQYGGNISSMMWNAKTPEQDGTTLSRYAYVYRYDDLGQLTEARFAADDPSMPGEFIERLGEFDEMVNYDLGGNILKINRNHSYYGAPVGLPIVDELTYTYTDGYKLESVSDNAVGGFQPDFKHFVNGVNQTVEYTYDAGNRLIEDRNKNVRFAYNAIGLPMQVEHTASDYYVRYTYDAAGNKLQKYQYLPPCPPGVLCSNEDPYDTDYIGNFVYEKGELKMVYHPEGVIRPTPSQASNETEYVYDYFVKDYLGNVRAVITEEDAEIVDKFLATMEDVHAGIEEANFDNINETREDLPTGYPIDASVPFNQKIAELSATNGTEIGPSLVLPVRKGEKVSLSTRYFYEEDAPGTTYDNVGFFVDEILIALASSGINVLHLTEAQLLNIAAGDPAMAQSITNLLNSNFDNSDIYKPHAYLVWMLYDNQMKLIPQGSGAQKVVNPNELETLIESNITATADGYMHVYVSNGSEAKVNFDNFLVQHQKGKVRQINDYYPYGLTISGLHGDHDDYLDKYTGKELQTGEFDPSLSSGLEMFDFGSRFYDPQLGRWFAPDPAEQFKNPYLGIGNNPVRYIDPNGEWVHLVVGAVIGGIGGAIVGVQNDAKGWDMVGYIAVGAAAGAASAGIGSGVGAAMAGNAAAGGGFVAGFAGTATISSTGFVAGAATGAAAGVANGLISGTGYGMIGGQNFGDAFVQGGLDQAWRQGLSGAAVGGVFGGIDAARKGRNFWTGNFKQYDLAPALLASSDNMLADEFTFPDDATVANADDYRVYYRTEDGVSGTRNYVKPGKYIKAPVDGVATSRYSDQVYKIPNGGRVYVNQGGNVKLSMGTVDRTLLSVKEFIDPSYQYGWVKKSYFQNINAYDQGWKYLFRIAPLLRKFPVGY